MERTKLFSFFPKLIIITAPRTGNNAFVPGNSVKFEKLKHGYSIAINPINIKISLNNLFLISGIEINANKTPANNSQNLNGERKKTATGFEFKKYSEINNEKKNIIVNIIGIFFIFNLYKKIRKKGKKI